MKVIIFGNSGSGKSTLAKRMASTKNLGHLDLDTIAWQPISPPTRMAIEQSQTHIDAFLDGHSSWVIEGCYADLIERVIPFADQVIFMNLPVSKCIENAKARPWEPHKYESKQAQDANLEMLIAWIQDYDNRSDTFSRASHEALYENFSGAKVMHTSNIQYRE